MRTTVILDDDLLEKAQELTGIKKRSALINEGLRRIIQQESARRLARLGGSEPGIKPIPRRRPER